MTTQYMRSLLSSIRRISGTKSEKNRITNLLSESELYGVTSDFICQSGYVSDARETTNTLLSDLVKKLLVDSFAMSLKELSKGIRRQ